MFSHKAELEDYDNYTELDVVAPQPPENYPQGTSRKTRMVQTQDVGHGDVKCLLKTAVVLLSVIAIVHAAGFGFYIYTIYVENHGSIDPAGPPGSSGVTGKSCLSGAPGVAGPSGARGNPGPSGARGLTGMTGAPGDVGARGLSGSDGLLGPTGRPGASTNHGGGVYTRWGRTACSEDADVVYTGIVGGSHYTHSGSGANYLCLHRQPQWQTFIEGHQHGSGAGIVYGAEYQIPSNINIFPGKNLNDNNVPCVVCQTRRRPIIIMIPARLECPNSTWTLEYKGYLMTEHYAHKSNMVFECVDADPETVQGGAANQYGAFFYPVEGHCGSLPCPNYIAGRELTCVVCSM